MIVTIVVVVVVVDGQRLGGHPHGAAALTLNSRAGRDCRSSPVDFGS